MAIINQVHAIADLHRRLVNWLLPPPAGIRTCPIATFYTHNLSPSTDLCLGPLSLYFFPILNLVKYILQLEQIYFAI